MALTAPQQSGAVTERVIWSRKLDKWLDHSSYTMFLTNKGMTNQFFRGRASKYIIRSWTTQGLDLIDYDDDADYSFGYDQRIDLASEEFEMTQKKSVSVRIPIEDQLYGDDSIRGGSVLSDFTTNVLIPYRDEYNLNTLYQAALSDNDATNAAKTPTGGRVWYVDLFDGQTGSVAGSPSLYDTAVKARSHMTNYTLGRHSMKNVVMIVPESNYAVFELDERVSKATELAQKMIVFDGRISKIGGLNVFPIPDFLWPTGVQFMLTGVDVLSAPYHLMYTKVHKNTPDYVGEKPQLLSIFDCFATTLRRQRTFVCRTTDGTAIKGF